MTGRATDRALFSRMRKLLGPAGSGQLAKMCNQIAIAGLVQGLAEAVNFGMKAGLDMLAVVDVISKGRRRILADGEPPQDDD